MLFQCNSLGWTYDCVPHFLLGPSSNQNLFMLPGIQEEPVASNLKVRTFTNNNNTNLCDLDNWIILDVSKNNYFRCQ